MTHKVIALAADHGGYELKAILKEDLRRAGHHVMDLGTEGTQSVDYPDYAALLCLWLKEQPDAVGILVCGSGVGMSMAANRYPHIRAALVNEPLSARLAREHNDANVLVLGGRLIGVEQARECLKVFLEASFQGGRHAGRVAKMGLPTISSETP